MSHRVSNYLFSGILAILLCRYMHQNDRRLTLDTLVVTAMDTVNGSFSGLDKNIQ